MEGGGGGGEERPEKSTAGSRPRFALSSCFFAARCVKLMAALTSGARGVSPLARYKRAAHFNERAPPVPCRGIS